MICFREALGVQYSVFELSDLDEMACLLAEAFSRYDPPAVAMGLSLDEFEEFVRLLCPKAATEGLTIVARTVATGEMIGALLTEDFASPPPTGIDQVSEKFHPILTTLEQLDAQYRQGKIVRVGEYLHLFMIAVAHQHTGKKVAQSLYQVCLENGIRKGYKTTVTEATGVITQHILRNKFGFVDRLEIPYKTFTYQGRRVFSPSRGTPAPS
jgi:hypothetical protein